MIGKRITELRNARGLTQQAVAEGIGISRATYAHYEINRREPDNDTLSKIARFFNVSTDYMLGLSDLPNPYALAKNSPLYQLVLQSIRKEGFTPDDLQAANPELAGFMQDHEIRKAKAKVDLINGLSLETLEKLVSLVAQIKNETPEE